MRSLSTFRLLGVMLVALAAPGLAACGGDADDEAVVPAAPAGDATLGQTVFTGTCATCHGPDAMGLPNLGKNLHANAFVAERTDEAMVEFLKVGRPAGDPLNTTGVDMPPKGGNPALTDEDLLNVVAYVRTLK